MTERISITLHNPQQGHTELMRAEDFHEILRYDAATGEFFWRIAPNGRVAVGSKAGATDTHGYRQIMVGRRMHLAHRLAWLMAYGRWPDSQIDHINGVRDDNRLANLREATGSQNMQNTVIRKDNKSGVRGVHWSKRQRRWIACVKVQLARHHLGTFVDKEDAVRAVVAARASLFTHARDGND